MWCQGSCFLHRVLRLVTCQPFNSQTTFSVEVRHVHLTSEETCRYFYGSAGSRDAWVGTREYSSKTRSPLLSEGQKIRQFLRREHTIKVKVWCLPAEVGVKDILCSQGSWLWASENAFLLQPCQLCSKCCPLVYKCSGFCSYQGLGPWHSCLRVGSNLLRTIWQLPKWNEY